MTYTCEGKTFASIDAIKHYLMEEYGHPVERLSHFPRMADDQVPSEQFWKIGLVRYIKVGYMDGNSHKERKQNAHCGYIVVNTV